MTNYTADELHDKILRSLKENSAEFISERRKERIRRFQKFLGGSLLFSTGAVFGLLASSRLAAHMIEIISKILR